METYAVNMDSEHVSFATLMEGLYISDLSDLEKVKKDNIFANVSRFSPKLGLDEKPSPSVLKYLTAKIEKIVHF